jgi:hypothetical protein
MRSLLLVLLIGLPTVAFAQDCDALRRACDMRDQLGERGQGNCRRYHDACGQHNPRDYCAQLREACMYKDENSQQGQGNCKRYRDNCRS